MNWYKLNLLLCATSHASLVYHRLTSELIQHPTRHKILSPWHCCCCWCGCCCWRCQLICFPWFENFSCSHFYCLKFYLLEKYLGVFIAGGFSTHLERNSIQADVVGNSDVEIFRCKCQVAAAAAAIAGDDDYKVTCFCFSTNIAVTWRRLYRLC